MSIHMLQQNRHIEFSVQTEIQLMWDIMEFSNVKVWLNGLYSYYLNLSLSPSLSLSIYICVCVHVCVCVW